MTLNSPQFAELLTSLAAQTSDLEHDGAWPADQLQLLGDAGVLRWLIPGEFGGAGLSVADVTEGYYALSQSCLVTAFVLTQRNAAIQRIVVSDNQAARERWLPLLCTSDVFATVGISHLTTSRQHIGKPSVEVTLRDGGMELNGFIPWTTGAAFADSILTGGTLDDGTQILAMVDTSAKGIDVKPPARLLALNASHTGAVKLSRVFVADEDIIAGPAPAVMKQVKSTGTGSLTTSALALGAAASSLAHIQEEASRRPDLVSIHDQLAAEHKTIVDDMRLSMSSDADSDQPTLSSESIRQRANSFVLRCSQAYLGASKGAGFAKGHPAEQAVREAMFFLVWSCPQPVLNANLRELACVLD
jgi:alkylation response protein AidB-like acyl-CoA dehydrogenase